MIFWGTWGVIAAACAVMVMLAFQNGGEKAPIIFIIVVAPAVIVFGISFVVRGVWQRRKKADKLEP